MTKPEASRAKPSHIADLKKWRQREELLLAGKAMPTLADRRTGHSPFHGSALLDLRQFCTMTIGRDQETPECLQSLQSCIDVPTAKSCWSAYQLGVASEDTSETLLWHAAIRGHRHAVRRLVEDALQDRRHHDPIGWTHFVALALGLTTVGLEDDSTTECEPFPYLLERGMAAMQSMGSHIETLELAADALDDTEAEAETGMVGALAAMKVAQAEAQADAEAVEAMLEDRAEIRRDPALVVIDADPDIKQPSSRADVWKAYRLIIGQPLRLVSTAAVPAARTDLHARYPHMHAEIDAILGTQSALQSLRLAVLLVGNPGSGKTTFAREMADRLGVPAMTYSCAGASDGAFGGTSAQWNSARPATPLQLVGRTRTANPLIVLDEVDKMGTGRNNGSLADTLLTFLEPASSRVFFDLALEQPADLSAVSYIATANSLEDVPAALRDRFRIVRIPDAGFEHVGVLSERIIADLAQQRGLDRRWIEPLAQDEVDVVRQAWRGGSLRTLQRIVTRLIDGREALMGRA
ncbi:hypothetical protein ASD04_07000 [Devosia sp. Root436]|uniref:AAA family ATPase n=1 Tax=Devosia sp. Root436 TaxID=1736537 RepID=UPI0006FE7C5E|nr:AAA family ATPase [Devosia sp. Root436]KQX40370.1 hypothetical protein ASD04_07000 [Devosia sp. Root436]